MPATLRMLLDQPAFRLRIRAGAGVGSRALTAPLAWVHSSDLEDPTPWLSPGGLLLTDGTQFDSDDDAAWADQYVARLSASGVAALGFATRVVHRDIPTRLVDACARHGLILIEVADRAPFMAIISYAADTSAREQREQLEWSLAAQRGVARAALRPDGLDAVLQELERQLGCWVALFDAAGYRVPSSTRLAIPARVADEVDAAVGAVLARGTRGGVRISTADADITLQTLGRPAALQGVLAVGTRTRLNAVEHDLVTSVIALASIALDQSRVIDEARRHLRSGMLQLMLAGAYEVVGQTAEQLGGRLPRAPVRVCSTTESPRRPALVTELGLYAERHPDRVFFAEHQDRLIVISHHEDLDDLTALLRRTATYAGCSTPVAWPELPSGLREAQRAADRAGADRPFVRFEDLVSEGMLGLLESSGGPGVARRMLQPLAARPEAERSLLIASAGVWLEHNGAWDPAARQLGIHRHTLRNRITTLERLLALDLRRFADRAELWTALQLGTDRPDGVR